MKDNILVVFWTILLVCLFVITSRNSRADNWVMFGGPMLLDSGPSGKAKIFGARTQVKRIMGVYSSDEIGGWVDNRPGMSNSLYYAMKLGVEPGQKDGIYGKAYIGPALISSTDDALGGHLQFNEDIGFGVRDGDTQMGITYKHFSCGFLCSPNLGKDWIVFEMGLVW